MAPICGHHVDLLAEAYLSLDPDCDNVYLRALLRRLSGCLSAKSRDRVGLYSMVDATAERQMSLDSLEALLAVRSQSGNVTESNNLTKCNVMRTIVIVTNENGRCMPHRD